jgi:hypothetical protein
MIRDESPNRHGFERELDRSSEDESSADYAGPIQTHGDSQRCLLSAGEVARYCSVPTAEVLGWIDTGRLLATRVRYGAYRIAIGDFMAFISRYAFLI